MHVHVHSAHGKSGSQMFFSSQRSPVDLATLCHAEKPLSSLPFVSISVSFLYCFYLLFLTSSSSSMPFVPPPACVPLLLHVFSSSLLLSSLLQLFCLFVLAFFFIPFSLSSIPLVRLACVFSIHFYSFLLFLCFPPFLPARSLFLPVLLSSPLPPPDPSLFLYSFCLSYCMLFFLLFLAYFTPLSYCLHFYLFHLLVFSLYGLFLLPFTRLPSSTYAYLFRCSFSLIYFSLSSSSSSSSFVPHFLLCFCVSFLCSSSSLSSFLFFCLLLASTFLFIFSHLPSFLLVSLSSFLPIARVYVFLCCLLGFLNFPSLCPPLLLSGFVLLFHKSIFLLFSCFFFVFSLLVPLVRPLQLHHFLCFLLQSFASFFFSSSSSVHALFSPTPFHHLHVATLDLCFCDLSMPS